MSRPGGRRHEPALHHLWLTRANARAEGRHWPMGQASNVGAFFGIKRAIVEIHSFPLSYVLYISLLIARSRDLESDQRKNKRARGDDVNGVPLASSTPHYSAPHYPLPSESTRHHHTTQLVRIPNKIVAPDVVAVVRSKGYGRRPRTGWHRAVQLTVVANEREAGELALDIFPITSYCVSETRKQSESRSMD